MLFELLIRPRQPRLDRRLRFTRRLRGRWARLGRSPDFHQEKEKTVTAAFVPHHYGLTRFLVFLAIALTAAMSQPAKSAAPEPRDDLFGTESALVNGDFEKGSDNEVPGWYMVWPNFAEPEPELDYIKEEAHGGRCCASILTHHEEGYTSWTQDIENPPKSATLVHLEGWIRFGESEEGGPAVASLLILFLDSERKKDIGLFSTPSVTSSCREWKKVEIDVPVPDGAKNWMVRCGVSGRARVLFDDIRLTCSTKEGNWVPALLAEAACSYQVQAAASARKPWALLSIPFPYMGQTPLGIRVTSEPEKAVDRIEIVKDRENRFLRIRLKRMKIRERVKLDVRTLVLLRDRPMSDGRGIAVSDPRKAPKEVKPFLEPADGLESEDKKIRKIAAGFERTDLAALMTDLIVFLRENIEYEGGGNQGAKASIASKKAVCTGFANVAAALLIAAGVPARILACTLTEGELQEHYIVEAWTRELGWSRLESTAAEFPWGDTRNVIVRIVYPDASRTPYNVPIFYESGGGITMGADMSATNGCWQSATTLQNLIVRIEDVEPLEESARKAFEKMTKRAVRKNIVSFIPPAGKMREFTDYLKKHLREAEDHLSKKTAPGK